MPSSIYTPTAVVQDRRVLLVSWQCVRLRVLIQGDETLKTTNYGWSVCGKGLKFSIPSVCLVNKVSTIYLKSVKEV